MQTVNTRVVLKDASESFKRDTGRWPRGSLSTSRLRKKRLNALREWVAPKGTSVILLDSPVKVAILRVAGVFINDNVECLR